MKKIKLLLTLAAILCATTASAQYHLYYSDRYRNGEPESFRFNGNQRSSDPGPSRSRSRFSSDTGDYNRLQLDFSMNNIIENDCGYVSDDQIKLKGFNLTYIHGMSIAPSLPFFVELGGQMAYNTNKEEGLRDNLLSLAIPVSLTYKQSLGRGAYIAPYFGARFKVNVVGQTVYYGDGIYNWFSENDYYEDFGDGYRRFQIGGIAGLNIGYRALNLNIGYQFDSPLFREDGYRLFTRGVTVGIGVNF